MSLIQVIWIQTTMVWPQLSGSTQASNNISLSITTDNWPEETWDLVNSNGTVVSSGGPYTGQANTVFTEEWDLNPGCYTFNVYDQYGDGVEASMWGTYDDGIVILTDLGSWMVVFLRQICGMCSIRISRFNII